MESRKVNLEFEILEDIGQLGLNLKRDLTTEEARYVLETLVGVVSYDVNDFEDADEYTDYCVNLTIDINDWLRGKAHDEYISNEYFGDCAGDHIGVWVAIPIIEYLTKIGSL